MSQKSAIGWTDATWNPVTGCSHVSPGCVNCYAETLSLRFGRSTKPWTAQNAAENVKLHPERLDAPLRWRAPAMVFVNSMSDLFHEQIPDAFIDRVFGVMAASVALNKGHVFQVLTKRPARMRAYVNQWRGSRDIEVPDNKCGVDRANFAWPLPNVWLGVSVEDQRRADERIPLLGLTQAAVRFISAEPLLASVNLCLHYQANERQPIEWVIVGGESGANYRPMEVAWAEEIAAQCADANVALYVKQDSGPRPGKQGRLSDALWSRKEYPGSPPNRGPQ